MKKYTKILLAFTLVTLGLFSCPVINKVYASPTKTQKAVLLRAVSYNPTAEPKVNQNITRLAQQRRKYHYHNISWNFRDIGGYNAYNNRYHVRTGKLYLSSYLGKINKRGARQLNRLHVHTDIDMRNYKGSPLSIISRPQPGEMRLRKNRLNLHLRYLNYPVCSNKRERHNWAAVPSRFRNNYYFEIKHFGGQYLITPTAKQAYRHSFLAIMRYTNKHNAIMFNCSSGRDRSACLAALILGLLGVNKSTIEGNYLLTNYFRYQTPYTNQVKRVQTLCRTIKKRYHSVYNYATSRNGLNLSRHFVKEFRHRFLVKN